MLAPIAVAVLRGRMRSIIFAAVVFDVMLLIFYLMNRAGIDPARFHRWFR